LRERERERQRELEMICNDFFVAIIEGKEKESKPKWVATTLEKYCLDYTRVTCPNVIILLLKNISNT
jgi:hypothetical protein